MSQRKTLLFTLSFINFTHIIDSMLIMPLGDIFIETFKISATKYSYLVSAYAFAAFLSAIIGIKYLDRFDRKKALVFIYSGFSIGTFICAFANSYEILLASRFLTGLFGGIIGALVLSIVSDIYSFKERGYAMGILMAAFSAASAFGVPTGIFLAAKGNWQLPFFIIGIVGFIISILLFLYFPSITKHLENDHPKKNLRQILNQTFRDKNQMNALTAGFILVFGHFLIIPFISPYMIKNVGLSQMEITYQFFFGGLATVITANIIGKMTDRFGVQKIFLWLVLLAMIPTVLITNLKVVPLGVAIGICVLFFIFASGRFIPANAIITASTGTENRGSFMSLKSALQQLAIALSAFVSGGIVGIQNDQYVDYPIVGYMAIIITLSSVYFLRKLKVAQGN